MHDITHPLLLYSSSISVSQFASYFLVRYDAKLILDKRYEATPNNL